MNVLKALARISITYVAYVCLLLGFVALGTFVYALAAESSLAWVSGVSLIGFLTAAVLGFRVGARKLLEANESDSPLDSANVCAQPLRKEQIDRYLLAYRGAHDVEEGSHVATFADNGPTLLADRRAA
jgi:hypothetical protein